MGKIQEWWTSIKKYNFDEAVKVLDLYENDFKHKGYAKFEIYKPNYNEKKTIFIVKAIILAIVLLSFCIISYILFKNFDEEWVRLFIVITSCFFLISILLSLLMPDKTKYVEWIKITSNEIIIKLQDKRNVNGEIFKYNINSSSKKIIIIEQFMIVEQRMD